MQLQEEVAVPLLWPFVILLKLYEQSLLVAEPHDTPIKPRNITNGINVFFIFVDNLLLDDLN